MEDATQILGIARQGGVDLLGKHTRTSKGSRQELPPPELFVPDESIGEAIEAAHNKIKGALVGAHERLIKMERRAEKDRSLVGKLTEDRENGLKQAKNVFENLKKTEDGLGECLGVAIIVLKEIEAEVDNIKKTGLSVATKHADGDGELGPFEDVEQKRFYEDVPEFLDRIPCALLGMTKEEVEERKLEAKKWYGEDAGIDREDISGEDEGEGENDAGDVAIEGAKDSENASDGEPKDGGEDGVAEESTNFKLKTLVDDEMMEICRREEVRMDEKDTLLAAN